MLNRAVQRFNNVTVPRSMIHGHKNFYKRLIIYKQSTGYTGIKIWQIIQIFSLDRLIVQLLESSSNSGYSMLRTRPIFTWIITAEIHLDQRKDWWLEQGVRIQTQRHAKDKSQQHKKQKMCVVRSTIPHRWAKKICILSVKF